jgi:hypothetical protein
LRLRTGLVWIVVFRQTTPYLWEQDQPLWLHPLNPSKPNFSILHFLEDCRSDDNGLFTLMYRDEHEGQFVVWEQSSNPATTSDKVSGFRVLHWGPRASSQKAEDEAAFCGLALSETHCVMDGNLGQHWWWYSVGAYEQHEGAMPGLRHAEEKLASKVELLVAMKPKAVDDLVTKISRFVEEQVLMPSMSLSLPLLCGSECLDLFVFSPMMDGPEKSLPTMVREGS